MEKRSVVYAFLPLGSKPTDLKKYVRIGHHATKHTDGSRARLNTRFNGLNTVREVLLMIEVDRSEVPRVYDYMRVLIMGPGTKGEILTTNRRLSTNWISRNPQKFCKISVRLL